MMMAGMGRKRGIFGGGFGASMPQDMTMQDSASLGVPAPQQQRPGIGTRLFGEGWEGKAAALGAMLAGNPGAIQQYQGQQQALQLRSSEQAAALAREQRQRAEGLADYRAKQQIDQEFAAPEAPKPGSFEWFQTATPEQRAQYGSYRDVGQDDEFVVVPIPGRGTYAGPRSGLPSAFGQGQAPSRPVGGLTPVGPAIENTPAPQVGQNGLPASLTRAQYQAVEQRMGRDETAAWARRNNIKVAN
jgi:hypothetical protein